MNHLQMNDTKSEFITFGTSNLFSKRDLNSITVGGLIVNCSENIKFLGVFLDETSSVMHHVAAWAKLALHGIHLIKNVRKYLKIATTKCLCVPLYYLRWTVSLQSYQTHHSGSPYLIKKSRAKLPESTKRQNGPVQHLVWSIFTGYQSDTGVALKISQLSIKPRMESDQHTQETGSR